MKISFKKINNKYHELSILRADDSMEKVELETNTFFLHDICHYYVESYLSLKNGFWGMLAQGYKMAALKGKQNELTAELRQIEFIAGGIQAIYSGHLSLELFEINLKNAGYNLEAKPIIENTIPFIRKVIAEWQYMPVGNKIELNFTLT